MGNNISSDKEKDKEIREPFTREDYRDLDKAYNNLDIKELLRGTKEQKKQAFGDMKQALKDLMSEAEEDIAKIKKEDPPGKHINELLKQRKKGNSNSADRKL